MYTIRAHYKKMEKSFNDLRDYIEEKFNDMNNKHDEVTIDRYQKNGVSKSIVHVIKHTNFQLYRVQPDGVI